MLRIKNDVRGIKWIRLIANISNDYDHYCINYRAYSGSLVTILSFLHDMGFLNVRKILKYYDIK